MQPQLTDLIRIARQAGEIQRAGFGQTHQVGHKGPVDLVTEIDHRCEAHILNAIQSQFPGHHIVAEESGQINGGSPHTWYVDPLDGTVNYAHSVPLFSVSIAYAEGGQTQLGVVYDPMRDECFSAQRGHGAWLNDQPIRVSSADQLIDALLVTGFPYELNQRQLNLELFADFSLQCQGVRRLGSAALDLCYVAAGRLDGYWELSLQAWDVAAGALIVQEAGGVLTAPDGQADFFRPPFALLTANPQLYPLMLKVLRQHMPA